MAEEIETNAYIEITRRDATKERIRFKFDRGEVEAGLYDYAVIQIFDGRETIRAGWFSEIDVKA